MLPLGEGMFTRKATRVPIIVASTKADLIQTLSVPARPGWGHGRGEARRMSGECADGIM